VKTANTNKLRQDWPDHDCHAGAEDGCLTCVNYSKLLEKMEEIVMLLQNISGKLSKP